MNGIITLVAITYFVCTMLFNFASMYGLAGLKFLPFSPHIAVVITEISNNSAINFLYIHLLFVNRQHNKENTKIRKEVVNKIAVKYEHYIHGRISSRANTTKTKNQTRSLRAIQLIIHYIYKLSC